MSAYDTGIVKFSCENPPGAHAAEINYGKIKALISIHSKGGIGTEPFPMFVVGYGRMAADNPDPNQIYSITLPDPRLKIRPVDVRAPYGSDSEAFITLQGNRGFICHGDSGGALFADEPELGSGVLFGVSTRMGYGAGCTTTSFAARIDTNYDWLRRAMIELGAQTPIPARSSGASDCAHTQIIAHSESDPFYQEIRTTNSCSNRITCSILGWMLMSSGKPTQFKDTEDIEPNSSGSLKNYTKTPKAASYATAICDAR